MTGTMLMTFQQGRAPKRGVGASGEGPVGSFRARGCQARGECIIGSPRKFELVCDSRITGQRFNLTFCVRLKSFQSESRP